MTSTPTKQQALTLSAVLQWHAASTALAEAKANEAELRAAAVRTAFPDGLHPGTTNLLLHDGSTLKAEVRQRTKVDAKRINPALAKLRKLGADGVLLAQRLVKWNPDASLSEFKRLSDDQAKLFGDGIIAIEAGSPTLELKAAA